MVMEDHQGWRRGGGAHLVRGHREPDEVLQGEPTHEDRLRDSQKQIVFVIVCVCVLLDIYIA